MTMMSYSAFFKFRSKKKLLFCDAFIVVVGVIVVVADERTPAAAPAHTRTHPHTHTPTLTEQARGRFLCADYEVETNFSAASSATQLLGDVRFDGWPAVKFA